MVFSTRRIALFAATAAALFVLPAAASADVYCVDITVMQDPTCDHVGYTAEPGLQNALNAAAADVGPDTVRIAALEYDTTSPDGFQYSQPADPITIEGVGIGAVISVTAPLAPPVNPTGYFGLEVQSGGGLITLSNMKFSLPTPPDEPTNENQHYLGALLHDQTSIADVTIDAPAGVGINGAGIEVAGGTVSNLTVDLPTTGIGLQGLTATALTSTDLTVQNSVIKADIPVTYANTGTGSLLVRRAMLQAGPNGGVGVLVDYGHAALESTTIDLGGLSGGYGAFVGFNNPASHSGTLELDGVTIANGGFSSRGLVVDAGNLGGTDQFTLNARNTIIDQSIDTAIFRRDDAGAASNITTAYSNYDPTSVFSTNDGDNNSTPPFGTGSISATNQTNLTPMFVSGTDFHLQSSSPLIDIGDPVAPAPGALDIDGDGRAILGKPGCGPRRDIGADEYAPITLVAPLDCSAPDTSVTGKAKVKTRKKRARVSWTFSSEPGASFECSLDGAPFAPCSSPLSAVLRKGAHTLQVRASDASGNKDASPASFTTRVKRLRVRR